MKKQYLLFLITIILIHICLSNDSSADFAVDCFQDTGCNKISNTSSVNRQPAEFERMSSVLISFSKNEFGIPFDVIEEMAEDVEVITIVDSESQQNYVISLFENNNIDLNNCSFLLSGSDSYWTRDYGPWFVFNETGMEMEIVDFNYNRPRPNDNDIPYEFAVDHDLNYSYLDVTHTGGNYMTDGHGISMSTQLIWDENSDKEQEKILFDMEQSLGVHTYYVHPDVNGEYIKHIDCWAKLVSPDTIMIREVPPEHSQFDEIEQAVDFFESQLSCYKNPYNIVRVLTPNDEPYTNSLILNDKVFVPLQGTEWDVQAIESYENAMPGYEILGFSAGQNPWLSTDAIHCRTKGIPDSEMLYIDHIPLDGLNGFTIKASIIAFSGEAVKNVGMYWKIDGGDWEYIEMNNNKEYLYQASIPLQNPGETVSYYIIAEDYSGRIETHPFIGVKDPHVFSVENSPPKKPSINGVTNGKIETFYEYSFISEDVDSDNVSYFIEWGDGMITNWTDYSPSNTFYIENHSFNKQGVFALRAKCRDSFGAESDWETININMPKHKRWNSFLLTFLKGHTNFFYMINTVVK